MHFKTTLTAAALGLGLTMMAPVTQAAEVSVAVAANFTAAAKDIAKAFQEETGDEVKLSFGSTGKLYTQIENGAPFEIFLAADQKRPEKLEKEDAIVPGSRFTYAVGQLALWSSDPDLIDAKGEVLKENKLERLAIANPKTAPYGAAAEQTLEKMGLWDKIKSTTVRGENIGQTFQMAKTGAVPAAMVAASQIALDTSGSSWMIPSDMYSPIQQDAVLLKSAADDKTAQAFYKYLQGDKAHEIIKGYGYALK